MNSTYCKVVAIINMTDYAPLHETIHKFDVPGVSVSRLKGFGDYVNEFNPCGFSEGMKIEIYTDREQAVAIADEIAEIAKLMTEGGGMVAVEPVDLLLNVGKLRNA